MLSSLFCKGSLFAIGVVVWWVVRAMHRRRANGVLAALDDGRRCIRCDGSETTVEDDRVRCGTCGFVASLSGLRASTVRTSDIDAGAPLIGNRVSIGGPKSALARATERGLTIEALDALIRQQVGDHVADVNSVDVMLGLYRSVRVHGCALHEDGDMLLFEWGTSSGRGDASFEVALTRQLALETNGERVILQIRLAHRLPATSKTDALGEGNRWCASPAALDPFAAWVRSHDAVALLRGVKRARRTITIEAV